MAALFALDDRVIIRDYVPSYAGAPDPAGRIAAVNGAGPWTYDVIGTDQVGGMFAVAGIPEGHLALVGNTASPLYAATDLVVLVAPFDALYIGGSMLRRAAVRQVIGAVGLRLVSGGVLAASVNYYYIRGADGGILFLSEPTISAAVSKIGYFG